MYLIAVLLYLGPLLAVSGLWAMDMVSGKWFLFAGIWIVMFTLWSWTERDQKRKKAADDMKENRKSNRVVSALKDMKSTEEKKNEKRTQH